MHSPLNLKRHHMCALDSDIHSLLNLQYPVAALINVPQLSMYIQCALLRSNKNYTSELGVGSWPVGYFNTLAFIVDGNAYKPTSPPLEMVYAFGIDI